MVSSIRSIPQFIELDIMHLVCVMGKILELYLWNRGPFISPSYLGMVSYATRWVAKPFAEAQHSPIMETYWNTPLQPNNMWCIAFDAGTKEIRIRVCCSNSPRWILHTQTGTRFEHKSIRLNPIVFNQQVMTLPIIMISTALNPLQSIWNSLIPF